MKISIQQVDKPPISVEIPADEDVNFLKEIIQIESGVEIPQQVVSFQGRELTEGTLRANGLTEEDTILQLQVATAASAAGAGGGAAAGGGGGIASSLPRGRAICIGDIPSTAKPEEYLELVAAHPHLLTQYRSNDTEFADALATNDLATVRRVLMLRHMGLHKRNFSQQQELARIDQDPTNEENQRKIEEMIRLQNIQANMESAMENMPEAFGRVVMLYIDVKVNAVPVKCFVDSGAQSTIMTARCVERVGLRHLIDTRFKGEARGVGTAKILGRIHIADMQLGGNFFPVSITVLEGGDVDFLLGLDMLKHHRAVLDMGMGTLRFEGSDPISFLSESEMPAKARGNYSSAGDKDEEQAQLEAVMKKSRTEVADIDAADAGTSNASSSSASGAATNNSSTSSSSAGSSAAKPPTVAAAGTSTAAASSNAAGPPPPPTAPAAAPAVSTVAATTTSTSNTSTGGPSTEVEKVRYLVEMGFTTQEAENALREAGGEVFLAASMLLLSRS